MGAYLFSIFSDVYVSRGNCALVLILLSSSLLKVVEGFDVVQTIEGSKTGAMDRPVEPVVIADCGEV